MATDFHAAWLLVTQAKRALIEAGLPLHESDSEIKTDFLAVHTSLDVLERGLMRRLELPVS